VYFFLYDKEIFGNDHCAHPVGYYAKWFLPQPNWAAPHHSAFIERLAGVATLVAIVTVSLISSCSD